MSENDPRCAECGAECCRYISVTLNKPRNKDDHDEIRWFLRHENVNVYIDHEKDWILEFVTPCEYLDENNRCSDYENRPEVCSTYDPDDCPPTLKEPPYKRIFHTHQEYDEYLAEFKRRKTKKKSKKGKMRK